jgi:hypothetical protein
LGLEEILGALINGPDGDKGSGRNIVGVGEAEQVVEPLHQGVDPLCHPRAHHTGADLI